MCVSNDVVKGNYTHLRYGEVVGFSALLCDCECCSCGVNCECVAGVSVCVYGDEVLGAGFEIAYVPCWVSGLWLWDVV